PALASRQSSLIFPHELGDDFGGAVLGSGEGGEGARGSRAFCAGDTRGLSSAKRWGSWAGQFFVTVAGVAGESAAAAGVVALGGGAWSNGGCAFFSTSERTRPSFH